MDVGVVVKAALDVNVLRSDPQGLLAVENIPLVISEYDRNAIYEARKIADLDGSKVYIYSFLTWGPVERMSRDFDNVMREALALGGDEAFAVVDKSVVKSEPIFTAEVLSKLIRRYGSPSLILSGEASTDMTSSSLPGLLASKLGYNLVSFARRIEVEDNGFLVERDAEDYIEKIYVEKPAVISVTGEINSPKLPTLIQIRKAFRKPLNKLTLSDLGVTPVLSNYEEFKLVTVKRKRVIIEDKPVDEMADELINYLISEGVVKI